MRQQGSGGGQGQGGGSSDAGWGSSNLDQSSGQRALPRQHRDIRFNQEERDAQLIDWVRLYDARQLAGTQTIDSQVSGQMGEGDPVASIDVKAEPTRGVAPSVKETRAFYDYREAQKEALAKEDIPLGYKEFVKDYFDSLRPPSAE
jgi:hypothetical protein